jgi:hypothetical protein
LIPNQNPAIRESNSLGSIFTGFLKVLMHCLIHFKQKSLHNCSGLEGLDVGGASIRGAWFLEHVIERVAGCECIAWRVFTKESTLSIRFHDKVE